MLVQEVTISNFLSFGSPDTIPMQNLNVLVGPNGSGKSNFIEAIIVLRACATDVQDVLRKGGGVTEWLWKGQAHSKAVLNILVGGSLDKPVYHGIVFSSEQQRFKLNNEGIYRIEGIDEFHEGPHSFYSFIRGVATLFVQEQNRVMEPEEFDHNKSILSQRRDPVQYPQITYLATEYEKIRVYREWEFGRNATLRDPQRADGRSDFLEEDFSNLAMFLNRLMGVPSAKRAILVALKDIYDGVTDLGISIIGGTVQIFLEEGDYTIPSIRLSDGTLRYLCLLAILCDPTPPPLICIEEPELGMHPDLIPKLAGLLVDAAERTQLIVTTHSEMLVDALTAHPEAILVCEKHDGKTQIHRLDANELAAWLERYRLGDLWTKGVLGGTRW